MDEDQIIGELKRQGIDLVSSVPCDRAKGLFFKLPQNFRHIGLTREEDGVGISPVHTFPVPVQRLPSRAPALETCLMRFFPSR